MHGGSIQSIRLWRWFTNPTLTLLHTLIPSWCYILTLYIYIYIHIYIYIYIYIIYIYIYICDFAVSYIHYLLLLQMYFYSEDMDLNQWAVSCAYRSDLFHWPWTTDGNKNHLPSRPWMIQNSYISVLGIMIGHDPEGCFGNVSVMTFWRCIIDWGILICGLGIMIYQ